MWNTRAKAVGTPIEASARLIPANNSFEAKPPSRIAY